MITEKHDWHIHVNEAAKMTGLPVETIEAAVGTTIGSFNGKKVRVAEVIGLVPMPQRVNIACEVMGISDADLGAALYPEASTDPTAKSGD